jgi:hypothetical protein
VKAPQANGDIEHVKGLSEWTEEMFEVQQSIRCVWLDVSDAHCRNTHSDERAAMLWRFQFERCVRACKQNSCNPFFDSSDLTSRIRFGLSNANREQVEQFVQSNACSLLMNATGRPNVRCGAFLRLLQTCDDAQRTSYFKRFDECTMRCRA